MIGKQLRLKRIFNRATGKSVIVAMDHGQISGPARGLVSPREAVARVVAGRPDAILTTRGVVQQAWDLIPPEIGVIIRLTGGFTTLGGKYEEALISSVEHSLKLDAAGVAVTVKYGHEREDDFVQQASLVADECYAWGVPLLTEVWPTGKNVPKPTDPEAVALGARAAAEFGTDMVKTFYTGSRETFSTVVSGCPVPVVVLGGEKLDSPLEIFKMVEEAMQAGAAGIAMGRNIWGHEDPARMIEALRGIVHDGWTSSKANEYLGGVRPR